MHWIRPTLLSPRSPGRFGKTTILSEWVAEIRQRGPRMRVAWLSREASEFDGRPQRSHHVCDGALLTVMTVQETLGSSILHERPLILSDSFVRIPTRSGSVRVFIA